MLNRLFLTLSLAIVAALAIPPCAFAADPAPDFAFHADPGLDLEPFSIDWSSDEQAVLAWQMNLPAPGGGTFVPVSQESQNCYAYRGQAPASKRCWPGLNR